MMSTGAIFSNMRNRPIKMKVLVYQPYNKAQKGKKLE